MNWEVITDFILQQGIWCALFVWLFFTSRKEAREREQELQGIIKEQGEQMEDISKTLQCINTKIEQIEEIIK